MNIAEAKDQIRNAMIAYFTKNEFGNYRIPIEKQRPIFLIGPPGVGKTAIMEQIASELGVGLVSYSMTHHTRQSALGLPYIVTKEYEGYSYQVTEYTMSEVIGSIYDLMRDTGVKEGILFLDEINCVSETLAPSMLQFLQYKVFGQHHVPNGWIVVTAGNPPEYNKSVRDFDVVTWDRMKRIAVEPDYEVWKKYATSKGVHASVLTYLSTRKKDFYKIENTIDGKRFVTPRGWDDLSEMIKLYEENHIKVDEKLVCQYLQDERIAKDFAVYYDLFNKYRSDYQVENILAGKATDAIIYRAQMAPFDEKVSLLGLLFDAVNTGVRKVCEYEDTLNVLMPILKKLHSELNEAAKSATELLEEKIDKLRGQIVKGRKASTLSASTELSYEHVIRRLEDYRTVLLKEREINSEQAFITIKEEFGKDVALLKQEAFATKRQLNHVFEFLEKAFSDGDEILIFVTELTSNYFTARFIGHYGCDPYFAHNKELQFKERQKELIERVEQLDWTLDEKEDK